MTEFVSEIKTIPHTNADVYTVLSDLSYLEQARDRMPEGAIKDLTFEEDSCSITADPIGKIKFKVVEREPQKTVKFVSEQLPFDVTMWIQLLSSGESETKMKLTVKAELNPFIKPMVSKPLQSGIEKVADRLSKLPYSDILKKEE